MAFFLIIFVQMVLSATLVVGVVEIVEQFGIVMLIGVHLGDGVFSRNKGLELSVSMTYGMDMRLLVRMSAVMGMMVVMVVPMVSSMTGPLNKLAGEKEKHPESFHYFPSSF